MIATIISIVGMITGVVGMILGIYSLRVSQYNIVKEYFRDYNSDELREARKNIFYVKEELDQDMLDNEYYAIVCNHYHYYGLLAKKHYLPNMILKGVNGYMIIKSYEYLEKYIKLRRKMSPYYAEYFEWLYKHLKKKGY